MKILQFGCKGSPDFVFKEWGLFKENNLVEGNKLGTVRREPSEGSTFSFLFPSFCPFNNEIY